MNFLKRIVTGLGNQTAPFGFSPNDPEAAYKAGLGYIGDVGANMLANNQPGVDPFSNLGASLQQAKSSSTTRNKEAYTAQRLMEEAAMKRQEREQADAERMQREEFLKTLPPEVQMKARSVPGFLEDYIKATDPAFQTAPELTADMRNFQFAQENPEFAGFLNKGQAGGQGDLPKGYRWKEDGSGAEPIPGVSVPGTNMRLTEQQSKDLVYYQRGESALENLEKNEAALTGFLDTAADYLPGGNYLTSTDYQAANQAAREFLAAILRKDTGAAITNQEMDIYGSMYLPKPGDGPEVLAQKRQARRVALNAIKSGLGAAQGALPQPGPITTEDGFVIEPFEE